MLRSLVPLQFYRSLGTKYKFSIPTVTPTCFSKPYQPFCPTIFNRQFTITNGIFHSTTPLHSPVPINAYATYVKYANSVASGEQLKEEILGEVDKKIEVIKSEIESKMKNIAQPVTLTDDQMNKLKSDMTIRNIIAVIVGGIILFTIGPFVAFLFVCAAILFALT